jgi:hypothetical protein
MEATTYSTTFEYIPKANLHWLPTMNGGNDGRVSVNTYNDLGAIKLSVILSQQEEWDG